MQTLNLPMGSAANDSLQVGDVVYYSIQNDVFDGGFDTGFNEAGGAVYELGVLISMSPNPVVLYDDTVIGCATCTVPLPTIGDFIMFQKDQKVNNASVLGYYMNARFINYSRGKIELFSIGSEVSESSK